MAAWQDNGIWGLGFKGLGFRVGTNRVQGLGSKLKSLRLSPPTQRRRKHESLNAKP